MTRVPGGITAPAGFSASGVSCGIKKRGKDLAVIFSDRPAAAAGILTRNALRAPCVIRAENLLKKSAAQAVVANSGNANCCTGRRGRQDTQKTADWLGKRLGIPASRIFVASTGVIGRPLPMDRVREGIEKASQTLSRKGSLAAAEAIMTTDTRPKEIAVMLKIRGSPVTVGGIAKGSGMVCPQMATMLAFLTTDARVEPASLASAIRSAAAGSFNAITVDGETSTNDMLLILANGASGSPTIRKGSSLFPPFLAAVDQVCRYLAHEIVRDGEGVTRLMTVRVTGAANRQEADRVARAVANSVLVKTMVAGRDPNWGRVAAAVGASGVPVIPHRLTIHLGKIVVFHRGEPTRLPRERLLEQVDHPQVEIGIDLGSGRARTEILSGDLTEGYIRINAKYTT
ncbi:MAG: bifunctional glutamate N-acetyltransferase/amino-acid acetyltransferase ArgJ [Candidatus Omnitrophica bacterium]|nr:bifunctional glutamate N-acetyltransferase/amino-acid acetyltransferase ArgJ [Candidatus Omnitrophota bacterium]